MALRYIEFRLLASGVGEYISVALCHLIFGTLLQQPQEPHTSPPLTPSPDPTKGLPSHSLKTQPEQLQSTPTDPATALSSLWHTLGKKARLCHWGRPWTPPWPRPPPFDRLKVTNVSSFYPCFLESSSEDHFKKNKL